MGLLEKRLFQQGNFVIFNILNVNSLEYFSRNNQECKIKPEIINLSTNEPLFYLYNTKINKYKGSCNTSMIHLPKYVFLTTLKTQMSKYLIQCQELMKQDT